MMNTNKKLELFKTVMPTRNILVQTGNTFGQFEPQCEMAWPKHPVATNSDGRVAVIYRITLINNDIDS